MQLLTQQLKKQLPALYAQTSKGEDATAYVKFFAPWSNWTWYASEYDPKVGIFYGLVDGLEQEYGYFSLSDLESVHGPLGLKIERDLYFNPQTFREILGKAV